MLVSGTPGTKETRSASGLISMMCLGGPKLTAHKSPSVSSGNNLADPASIRHANRPERLVRKYVQRVIEADPNTAAMILENDRDLFAPYVASARTEIAITLGSAEQSTFGANPQCSILHCDHVVDLIDAKNGNWNVENRQIAKVVQPFAG
jgi:hypothetical protein